MHLAEYGILPGLRPETDVVPEIPWYALTYASVDNDRTIKSKGQKDEQKTSKKWNEIRQ